MRRGSALILLALAATLLAPRSSPTARADGLEARRLWEAERARRDRPWPARLRALRAVAAAARPDEPYAARAAREMARALRAQGLVHGALAAEGLAARRAPPGAPLAHAARLQAAQDLAAELDGGAALALLGEVADEGRLEAPGRADRALALLAEAARRRGDAAALEAALDRLEEDRGDPALGVRLAGDLGMLRYLAGDVAGARRALGRARRAYEAGRRAGPRAERRATKAWLDLELRRHVEVAPVR